MQHYPLFLSLQGEKCLVVGAGAVGCRKIATLLKAGAFVLVLDTRRPKEIEEFIGNACFCFENREFHENDLTNCRLVFAASGKTDLNAHIASLCHTRNILCNIADNPAESDFFVPSHINRGSLTLAISTAGKSPAFTRSFKKELENWLDTNYAEKEQLVDFLGVLREPVLSLAEKSEENGAFFRLLSQGIYAENLTQALQEKNVETCKRILAQACAISYKEGRSVWARLAPLLESSFLF